MKIGIITFGSAHNYGAVLQVWALKEYLQQEGNEVEVINYRPVAIDSLYALYKEKNWFQSGTLNKCVSFAQYIKAKKTRPAQTKKYKKFEHFIAHDLNTTKPYYTLSELRKAGLDYDVMIAGSDQIWNGSLTSGINPAYFLAFGAQRSKRIVYAASIGRDNLNPEEIFFFQHYLKNLDYISVREQNAKDMIMRLTDQPVELVLDPTLLLVQDNFNKIKKDPKINSEYIYVHNVHLKRVDTRLNQVVEEMSKRLGLPVVQNRDDYNYKNEMRKFRGGSPSEFLGIIANASYVITNSFHATVFSILYQRNFITVPHFQNPDRMKFLLNVLGLENHLVDHASSIPENLSELSIDYSNVEQLRANLQKDSIAYLKNALSGDKKPLSKPVDRVYLCNQDRSDCTGCGACMEVCSCDSIHMMEDKEGFLYPQIDEDKCTHCNKCIQICEMIKQKKTNTEYLSEPAVYAGRLSDVKIQQRHAYSGVLAAFMTTMLKKQGMIVGARLHNDGNVTYDDITTIEKLDYFKNPIVVEPNSLRIKQKVEDSLREGKFVLFAGTSCQIAALNSFAQSNKDHLITVEITCNGLASARAYRQYRDQLVEYYHSPIVHYNFQDSFGTWDKRYTTVEFESKEVLLTQKEKNPFNKAYNLGLLQRPSCYSCEYKQNQYSVADISIANVRDGRERYSEVWNDFGISAIKINTKKGEKFWDECKDQLMFVPGDYKTAKKDFFNGSLDLTVDRDLLLQSLEMNQFEEVLKKYLTV